MASRAGFGVGDAGVGAERAGAGGAAAEVGCFAFFPTFLPPPGANFANRPAGHVGGGGPITALPPPTWVGEDPGGD